MPRQTLLIRGLMVSNKLSTILLPMRSALNAVSRLTGGLLSVVGS
jgi:hypothetical protein